MNMEEPSFESPLEITCEEAEEIAKLQEEENSSYMEDKLLEAHLRKCAPCREKKEAPEG